MEGMEDSQRSTWRGQRSQLDDAVQQAANDQGKLQMADGEMERLSSRSELRKAEGDLFPFLEEGLSQAEAAERLLRYGPNKLPSTKVPVWKQVLKLLTQPMALMMWVAAVIEAGIENFPDMVILLGIITINASISFYEMRKSGNAVAALQASMKPMATVRRDGDWSNMDAERLVPGDTVQLGHGSAVPADCRIHKGVITVDQAALTGESIPVKISGHENDALYPKMGTTVMTGEVEATVQKTGIKTMLGETAALLDRPPEYSNLDKVLFRIIGVMAGMSVVLSLIVFAFGIWKGESFRDVLSFTVVLIIASIPMAAEIVTTTTLALGARTLAAEGAIVTRLSSVEDMAGMNVLCSDKTGTLTLNEMQLTDAGDVDVQTIFEPGLELADVLQLAAMAAKWNEPPRDALDTLVLKSADLDALNATVAEQSDFIPFDPSVKFTMSTIRLNGSGGKEGSTFKVCKGAPDVIVGMCADPARKLQGTKVYEEMAARGIRCLAVAKAEGPGTVGVPTSGAWQLQAMLTFMDPPRPDSKQTVADSAALGAPVRMITGDHVLIAKETCRLLDLKAAVLGPDDLPLLDADGNAPPALKGDGRTRTDVGFLIENADGFAQVFPQHKYIIVDVLRQIGYKVGMTGDGVNDAAAMKVADVGVCVSGGTDAARAAADIVLTRPGLSTIVNGIRLSRKIFARINNFMCYRLAASMQLLFYFFVAVLTMHPAEYIAACDAEPSDWHGATAPNATGGGDDPAAGDSTTWPYMYGMPVLLLMMITLLNDGALITIGYDNVHGSPTPTVWSLKMLFFVSFILAAVACVSSLLLLHLALDSWCEGSVFRQLGLKPLSWGHVTTMMYLKVSVSDFLTLFSCRAGNLFWFESRPAPIVGAAAFIALSFSTAIACFYPTSTLDKMAVEGLASHSALMPLLVWGYCIFWWQIQDCIKVLTYRLIAGSASKLDTDKELKYVQLSDESMTEL